MIFKIYLLNILFIISFDSKLIAQWEEIYLTPQANYLGQTLLDFDKTKISNIIGTTDTYLILSTDFGVTWNVLKEFEYQIKEAHINGNNIYVALNSLNLLYKSIDLGKSWTCIHLRNFNPKLNDSFDINDINCLVLQGDDIFIGADAGLFCSGDFGVTWNYFIIDSTSIGTPVKSLIVIDKLIFFIPSGRRICFSYDYGKTWYINLISDKTIQLFLYNKGNDLFASDPNPDQGYVYMSKDSAITWNLIYRDSISDFPIGSITPCQNYLYFMSQDSFICCTNDNFKTINKYNISFNIKNGGSPILNNYKYLYIRTWSNLFGQKFYRAKLKDCEIDMTNDMLEIPKEYSFSISPNPAESYIYLNLPSEFLTEKIKIYSIEGIEVYSEPSEGLKPSEGSKIDVSSFAPGVYYVKVGDRVCRFIKI